MTRLFLALVVVAPVVAAAPAPVPISKEAYRRAAQADVAQLRKHLEAITGEAKKSPRFGLTARTMTRMLVSYAEALGDDGLKTLAVRVGRKIDEKDWKAAAELAAGFDDAKADRDVLKTPLPPVNAEVLASPFCGSKAGGLNIEKDTRDAMNGKVEIDLAAIELLGVRASVLADLYPEQLPPGGWRGMTPAAWASAVQTMRSASREVYAGAAKGEKGDAIKKRLWNLDASCSCCHFTSHE